MSVTPLTPSDAIEALTLSADKARDASNFLKALAHEGRLTILCLLADGERSVGEIERLLNERQSTVSQQLARLRLDGLVSTRRDRKTIYYCLANESVRMVIKALSGVFDRSTDSRRFG